MSSVTIDGIIYTSNSGSTALVSGSINASINPNSVILGSVTIGGTSYSVTSIGNSAFNNRPALTSIIIPNSVITIGDEAFYDCSVLASIIIPDSVISIGNYAFSACYALTSATIGNSVTSIGEGAFYDCTFLASIIIPDSVISIGNYAFQSCYALSVTIGNSVITIGNNAFENCQDSLTSIIIPNSVTSIGDYAFRECYALTSATIGNSVNSIGANAFEVCSALASIVFLNQNNLVTVQGTDVFLNTGAITSVTFYNTVNVGGLSVGGQSLKTQLDTNNTTPGVTYTYISPPPCFLEGSMILTDKGYLPIQNLRNGDLIRTLKHDFKPIVMIGKREINHPALQERIKGQLYKFSQKEYPEIFEPLVITGCHSILVNKFESEEQREKTKQVNGQLYVTDGKYRLPACAVPNAPVYETPGNYTIYHLALENDDYYMNYGIYANGLLVETCSKRYLKELSNMTLIE